jgi:predicted ATPase
MNLQHIVISGCSGGGKSTLLGELERRGFAVVPEPGRRIVEEEQRRDGLALPWVDLAAFAKRAIDLAAEDRRRIGNEAGWVFFDRGLVDAAVALEHATGSPAGSLLASHDRYHQRVFLTPPWPEIYVTEKERQHDLADAITEYDRLLIAYRELEYDTFILPKVAVKDRADFLLCHLSL